MKIIPSPSTFTIYVNRWLETRLSDFNVPEITSRIHRSERAMHLAEDTSFFASRDRVKDSV